MLCFLFLACSSMLRAQPFADEIRNFKYMDSLHTPPKHAVLFVGSSSFRIWTSVQEDFPGYTIINRGFGGSTFPDVMRYAKDIIVPYEPKQVVIYCGDNDLAASDTVTAQIILKRFKKLFLLIRSSLPDANIVYVSIKPSPSRQGLLKKMVQSNELIKKYLAAKPKTGFVDVYHLMLDPQGFPIDSLFREDKLHMNTKGYKIWQKAIQPFLLQTDSGKL